MSSRRMLLPYAAMLVTIGLALAGAFLPHARLWGVNHFAFLPPIYGIAALILVGLALIPSVGRALFTGLTRPAGATARAVTMAALATLALVLFLTLPAATVLLGDGVFVANNLETAAATGMSFGDYARDAIDSRLAYVGTELLNSAASRAGMALGSDDPLAGVRVLNAGLGVALLAILFAFVGGAQSRWMRLITCLALSSGVWLLFFGYIESYAPALVVGVLYVFTSLRTLHGRGPVWVPVVLFLFGFALHVQVLLLAPSLVYLLSARSGDRRRRTQVSFVLLVAVIAGALAARWIPGAGKHFLPFADVQAGVLSGSHLLDLLNLVLLLVPATLVLAGFGMMSARRTMRDGARPTGAFFLQLIVPAGLFMVLFRPALGMWRDWDLFALAAIGTVVAGAIRARRVWSRDGHAAAPVAAAAIVFSLVMTAGWVLVNADAERSVRRFEATLAYDQTTAGYANESLARYYERDGQASRAADAMDRAYAFNPNLRFLYKASILREQAGEREAAIAGLEHVLERDPRHDAARMFLLTILIDAERPAELLAVAQAGISATPTHFMYPYASGRALLAMGRRDEAIRYFERTLALAPPDEVRRDATELLDRLR